MRFRITAAVMILASVCLPPCGRCFAAGQGDVAVIFSSDIEPYTRARDGFNQSLVKNGVSGGPTGYNLETTGPQETLRRITRNRPAVVLAIGTAAAKFAKENLPGIPVVFCMVLDPEAVSGADITGVSMGIPAETKLAKMQKLFPGMKRIGVIYSSASAPEYAKIARASDELGLKLHARKIDSEKDFPEAVKQISWQIDYLLMIPDSRIYIPQSVDYALRESLKNKFPIIGLSSSYTKAGALMSFDCDFEDLGAQAGEIALKILAGAPPGGIPNESPRTVRISLNLLAAERLGVEIPPAVIRGADMVFGK